VTGEIFPPEFDVDYIRRHYSDLSNFSDEALKSHYDSHGRAEGRATSSAAHRQNFIGAIPNDLRVLEIGPFSRPMLRGENISYADIMTKEQICEETIRRGENPDTVPDIHYANGLAGIPEKFDCIISSHNIEHYPDFINHLLSVYKLLVEGGLYCLIIPDKRFIFDQSLAETNIAEIIEAHIFPRPTHVLRHVLEHYALTTHNDPSEHWSGKHGEQPVKTMAERLKHALNVYRSDPEKYFDVHAWKFIPSSFRQIVEVLAEMDFIQFRPLRVYETVSGSNEFCAVLQKL